ncbi:uncharacterized protein LOC125236324 [Leguminivora glycinivorella]|uniref:uncharacterized protein LOC125236324 n=1 Tax=Leguminivora glycinivorella TaxID=1035111 RepID=UPI00200C8D6E|nr:uncharacterized protein LOC125236324 [Leguminivora glycinivorella]
MSTAWIYQLKRPELVKAAEERNIETEGLTVDQLRKLLVDAVNHQTAEAEGNKPDEFKTPDKKHNAEMDQPGKMSRPKIIGKIIKEWNLTFKPGDSAVEFIERIEELISASEIAKEDVLLALPRILQGKALLWYRNNVDTWNSWEEFIELFKLYYFPANYEDNLIASIMSRKQKYKENFTDYLTDLQTLMRRYGNLSEKEKLHRIYENMQKNYKLYVKKQDFKDLPGLLQLTSEYENIIYPYDNRFMRDKPQEEEDTAPQTDQGWSPPTEDSVNRRRLQRRGTEPDIEEKINPKYDTDTCCWSCGKPGHAASECRSKGRLFCSICGKMGTLSKNCCKKKQWGKNESAGAAGDREDNRIYERVRFMAKEYRCLVDTGSTNTYINQQTYRECMENGAVQEEVHREVTLANGGRAQVNTKVLVDIQIKGIRIKHWVRVLPSASWIIIGMDVLRRIGMTITLAASASPRESQGTGGNGSTQSASRKENTPELEYTKKYYPRNPTQREIRSTYVKDALNQGIIQKSDSPYSSPVRSGKHNHIADELSRNLICTAEEHNLCDRKHTEIGNAADQPQECCVKDGKLYKKVTRPEHRRSKNRPEHRTSAKTSTPVNWNPEEDRTAAILEPPGDRGRHINRRRRDTEALRGSTNPTRHRNPGPPGTPHRGTGRSGQPTDRGPRWVSGPRHGLHKEIDRHGSLNRLAATGADRTNRATKRKKKKWSRRRRTADYLSELNKSQEKGNKRKSEFRK